MDNTNKNFKNLVLGCAKCKSEFVIDENDHIFYDRMAFNAACHDRLITDLSDWSLSIQWCVSMGSSYKLPKGSFITSWCLTVFVYVTNHYML